MTHRQTFINYFFAQIVTENYVLLKFSDESISKLDQHTDLDILINESNLKSILPAIKNDPSVLKIKQESKNTMTQLFIFFKDSSFLQIDFLFGFYRKTLEYLNKSEVMEHAVVNKDDIRVCANHHLLEHVFLFQHLNGAAIPEKYIQHFKKLPPEEYLRLIDYLNGKYKISCKSIECLGVFNEKSLEKIQANISLQRENSGLNRFRNVFKYWNDVFKSIRNKRGFTITFSGVDGAGKSTIIQEIKEILEDKFRRNVVVLRHRPSVLPILSAYKHGKEKAEKIAADTLPRTGKNKSKIASMVRFSYYYVDYILGQVYVKMKYHWRGYAVLYDRYYFDFIIDGKRSNIDLPGGIPKFFYRFVYKPPLNLFLYADPQTILKRKQELPSESIVELTKDYKNLFEDLSQNKSTDKRYISVENIDKEKTLKTIIGHYVEMI